MPNRCELLEPSPYHAAFFSIRPEKTFMSLPESVSYMYIMDMVRYLFFTHSGRCRKLSGGTRQAVGTIWWVINQAVVFTLSFALTRDRFMHVRRIFSELWDIKTPIA